MASFSRELKKSLPFLKGNSTTFYYIVLGLIDVYVRTSIIKPHVSPTLPRRLPSAYKWDSIRLAILLVDSAFRLLFLSKNVRRIWGGENDET
jgi:hypothetical protein